MVEQQQIKEALEGGVHAWNAFRHEQGDDWKPVLDGMDLRGIALYDDNNPIIRANLTNASMIGVQADKTTILDHADLNGATIAHSDIQNMSAKYVEMNGVTFYHNDARGINLDRASLDDSIVSQNKLQNANLVNTRYFRSTFTDNDVSHSNVAGAHFGFSYIGNNDFSGVESMTGDSEHKNPFSKNSEHFQGFEDMHAEARDSTQSHKDVTIEASKIENNVFDNADLTKLETDHSILKPDNTFTGTLLSESRHRSSVLSGVDLTAAETGESWFLGTDQTNVKMTFDQIEIMSQISGEKPNIDNMHPNDRRNDVNIELAKSIEPESVSPELTHDIETNNNEALETPSNSAAPRDFSP